MTAERRELVVCDAGPLIHLDQLGAIECLADMGTTIVPEAVVREVTTHRPAALQGTLLNLRRVAVTLSADSRLDYLSEALSLGDGEREALELMSSRRGHVFLTDDAAARFVASQLGFEVHGSMGVLILSEVVRQVQEHSQDPG